jgi:hypothetical protein
MLMPGAILTLVAIALVVLALRRRLSSKDPGLGYVSQSWLAELRASDASWSS